mgnify:CR=1 FL=1
MADINEQKAQTENFANAIWTVADILHGPFSDDEYGEVILPFALLRRFECVLEPTRAKVQESVKMLEDMRVTGDNQYSPLCVAAGFPFYNTSKFTLATIGAEHTKENLIAYKDAFSPNIRAIFDHFEFERICERLRKSEKIYVVVDFFKKLDLNVPPRVMSNLYEELIWRFADTKHKASKEYLTPRDVVHLATTLVLDSDGDALTSTDGLMRTIYDPTCGTCGFITDAMNFIREATADSPSRTTLIPYGQEINDIAWAMGKAMILLSGMECGTTGDKSQNILQGNTLKEDKHAGKTFDYVFSNPPFGMDWKDVGNDVAKDPRFVAGLPPKSDGSMLFLTHVARKMAAPKKDANGKVVQSGHAAIVLSGSPLFTGPAGSGSSEIRRWLLDQDIVEAIVQMPRELFYNTAISSYLWILNSGKAEARKNKVLLVNASSFKTPIKNIGKKRYMMSETQISQIAALFRDFTDTPYSKVLPSDVFFYRTITIRKPLRANLELNENSIQAAVSLESVSSKLSAEDQETLRALLTQHKGTYPLDWMATFGDLAKAKGLKLSKPMLTAIEGVLQVKNPAAQPCHDKHGHVVLDTSFKQNWYVPFDVSVDQFVAQEIRPFISDACLDRKVKDKKDDGIGKVGCEISFNKYFFKEDNTLSAKALADKIDNIQSDISELVKGALV